MSGVVAALRAAGVPVRVVADVDILSNREKLVTLVAALGGHPDDIERDWKIVDSAVRHSTSPLHVREVRMRVQSLLDRAGDSAVVTKEIADEIRESVKRESPWRRIREMGGINALPRGDASRAASALLDRLRTYGLCVVPVGDLERWAPHIGRHGPEFVNRALEGGVHEQEGHHARFILEVESSFA
jgi:uncharacterized protein YbjT (DUF2867 family)